MSTQDIDDLCDEDFDDGEAIPAEGYLADMLAGRFPDRCTPQIGEDDEITKEQQLEIDFYTKDTPNGL